VLGALSYGELASMNPEAGGIYVYVRDAFGHFAAFLYGWALFCVIASGSVATLAVAFSVYLGQLLPLSPGAGRAVAGAVVVAVAAINVLGTRKSAGVQNWTTGLKAGAILALGATLLARGGHWSAVWASGSRASRPSVQGIGLALVAVLWAYEGWQYATFAAGEIREPQRAFPRGICLGTLAVIALYLLANVAYLVALGPERALGSERIAADAAEIVFGPAAARLVALPILISMFSAANAITLTAPRVYFAMARDGLFFRRLAEIHPRFGTPAFSIVTSSAWAALLAVTGTFEQLLTYVVFVGWAFYALGAASIFYYRRHQPDAVRPFRVPGYPWTPLLFVLSAVFIVVSTILGQPLRACVGIAIVFAGAPVYRFWRGRGRRERAAPSTFDV